MGDMMAHLATLKDGVRHMSRGDPDCDDCVHASDVVQWAIDEIGRLRFAIRRLADQDATLSVCEGNVTVAMDATLTDAEREAVTEAADAYGYNNDDEGSARIETALRGLLERTKGGGGA